MPLIPWVLTLFGAGAGWVANDASDTIGRITGTKENNSNSKGSNFVLIGVIALLAFLLLRKK